MSGMDCLEIPDLPVVAESDHQNQSFIYLLKLISLCASSHCSITSNVDCWLKNLIRVICSIYMLPDSIVNDLEQYVDTREILCSSNSDDKNDESYEGSTSSIWSDLESEADTSLEVSDNFVFVTSRKSIVDELVPHIITDLPPTSILNIIGNLIERLVLMKLYDSRVRTTLKDAIKELHKSSIANDSKEDILLWHNLLPVERRLALENTTLLSCEEQPLKKSSGNRSLKIGAAAVGGGALLFYSGGLAAPAIAAASLSAIGSAITYIAPTLTSWITTNMVVASTVAAESSASYAAISSLFGATGASLVGYKMSRRTAGIKEFAFLPLYPETCEAHSGGLAVFICVPGWFDKNYDPRNVWGAVYNKTDADTTDFENKNGTESWDISNSATSSKEAEFHNSFPIWSDDQPEPEQLRKDESWEVYVSSDEEGSLKLRKNHFVYLPNSNGAPADWSSSIVSDGSWEELPREGWWRDCIEGGEEYILHWESDVLSAFVDAIREIAWQSASRKILGEFLRRSNLWPILNAASIPLALLNAAAGLDDPWTLALQRSKECGQLLADALLARPIGSKPVTMIGYSMGARVVFSCLEVLAKAGSKGLGIVESVVLLGAPIGKRLKRWRKVRNIVANRFVNGYSTQDFILALVYRSKSWKMGIAGISSVNCCAVENLNLSSLLTWHLNYPKLLPYVMAKLQLEK